MGAGAGDGGANGPNQGVKPGVLTALLQELVAPEAQRDGTRETLRSGAVVGRFELLRELGRGGFGVVWEARDQELGRSVAFKLIRAGRSEADADKLHHEAEVVARLQHPNLVTLYDVGRCEQGPFLVLELLRGETLQVRLTRGALPLGEALDVAVQVARGLAYAHAEGVVHRDLKPSNVFLCERGGAKLLDFGMAHAFGHKRTSGGTPGYMAPEQWSDSPEDERTDVFALGVMVYQMLAGTLPFPDDGGKSARGPEPAPQLEVPGALALGPLVAKMLSKDPAARIRDGGAVLAELERIATELPRGATVAAAPVVVRLPWNRRGRIIAAIAATVAVGLGGVALPLIRRAPWWSGPPSIAVLPFADMSPQKDQEYLSDGIAEEILNALAHVEGLHVTGRTSSFSFKGKSEDLRIMGHKLNVAAVLEGSVRKEGNRVRITAQVVSVADGYHLWSETYDRQLTDVFAVQDEIARAVVAALLPRLVGRSQSAPVASPATSLDVYNQYLIGRQFLGRYEVESYRRAAQAFEKALALDGSYAPAWAGLAEGLYGLNDFREEYDERSLLKRALTAADRAVVLAPQLAAGYHVRSLIRRDLWDWDGARADSERAVALQPSDATCIRRRALIEQAITGNSALVRDQFRYATQLDPLSTWSWTVLGDAYHYTGQADLARQAYLRTLEIDPDHQWAIFQMVATELAAGNLDAARRMAARLEQASSHLWWESIFAQKRGEEAAARESTEQYTAQYGDIFPFSVAELHAYRGEPDLAFEWLDRSFSRREDNLMALKYVEWLQPLHGDPRWKALLRKMNLPAD